jgi:hypothetical protein
MSPLYGVTKYGTPRKWGYGGMPAAVNGQRAIIGGQAPWMGDFAIPWRNACVTVSTVDPVTWEDDTELPALGIGGQRAATLDNWRYQRETLTLVLNDPAAYLPGGAYASLIARHTLLRPTWTVSSPGGTLTFPGCVYNVQSAPPRTDDVLGGQPLTLTAADWLSYKLDLIYSATGYITLPPLAEGAAVAITEQGMTPVGSGNIVDDPEYYTLTIATILASRLWYAGLQGTTFTVDPAWADMTLTTLRIPTAATLASLPGSAVPVAVQQPGQPATLRDVFDFLWLYEPFMLTYQANGVVGLHPGTRRRDSGFVVSRDAAVGGVLALPWETLDRSPRQAAFTGITYSTITNDPTDPEDGSGFAISLDVSPTGEARSTAPNNPYQPPRVKTVTDRSPGLWPATHLNEYARWLLDRELGQADPVSIALESAFPVTELGGEVRIEVPPRASGWWQLVSVNQPFSEAPQSITGEWRADA